MTRRQKIVTRKYYSKRLNRVVTKTYSYAAGRYDQPSRKSLTLISKNGTIYAKNWDRLREEIKKQKLDTATERGLLADLQNRLDNYKDMPKSDRRPEETPLTINGYMATGVQNKAERWITSLGYTPEQLAQEMNVSVEELLNEANWNKDVFKAGKKSYKFTHGYTGNAYKEYNPGEEE